LRFSLISPLPIPLAYDKASDMKLIDWRIRQRISRADAADMFGVSPTCVWQWEHGGRIPRRPQMAVIRRVTGDEVREADFYAPGETPKRKYTKSGGGSNG
jgi:transcriptional regulator with XRE-family HTH domain